LSEPKYRLSPQAVGMTSDQHWKQLKDRLTPEEYYWLKNVFTETTDANVSRCLNLFVKAGIVEKI